MDTSSATRPRGTALRWAAFVALHAALVALYLDALVAALPPLRDEGRDLVVVPVTALAAALFVGMHPILRRARTHLARLGVLAGAVALGIAVFTALLLVRLGTPEPTLASALGLAVLLVLAQVLYGAPLFVGLAATMKLSSPFLLARPVDRWA